MTSEAAMRALAACREGVDELDRKILGLLNERTKIVESIGRIKSEAGLPVYEPRREDAVFENVARNNHGPLSADAAKRIFERIIDEMRQLQRKKMSQGNETEK